MCFLKYLEISRCKQILVSGYGAIVALQLSLNHHHYPTVLINPISDIGAMSSSVDLSEWPYHVLGFNYTIASVPEDILTPAWEK